MGTAVEMRVQASARLQYAAAVQAVSWQKQSMLPKGGSSAERSQVRSWAGRAVCPVASLYEIYSCPGAQMSAAEHASPGGSSSNRRGGRSRASRPGGGRAWGWAWLAKWQCDGNTNP